jgi:hypothetical protein
VVVGTGGCELRQVLVCDLAWVETTRRLWTRLGSALNQRQLELVLVCVDGTPVGADADVVVVEAFEPGAGEALEVEVVVVVVVVEVVEADVLVADVTGVDEVDATVSEPEVTVLAVVALDFVAAAVVAIAVGVLATTVPPRAAAAAATHPDGADMARALAQTDRRHGPPSRDRLSRGRFIADESAHVHWRSCEAKLSVRWVRQSGGELLSFEARQSPARVRADSWRQASRRTTAGG